MIYLAADHGGFQLKEYLLKYLNANNFDAEDVGNFDLNPEDDYPDFALKAVEKLLANPEGNFAILACRSGSGEVIFANRFHGIRAVCSWTPEHAKKSREHNNSNILALPADYISQDEAVEIVQTWLSTDFSQEDRHVRRLNKIEEYSA